jgi:hypothetical protein
MIEHVWTVICSRAVVDGDSNIVSLQNVIEQINVVGEPPPDAVIAIELEVMTLWARKDFDVPARGHARTAFLLPSGKPGIGPIESSIDLTEFKRHRSRGRFTALPIGQPGRYTFRVDYRGEGASRWRRVAAVPLEVVFVPPGMERAVDEAR